MTRAETRRARLLESVALNREIRHYRFESPDAAAFDFEPGQHVCLSKTFDKKRIRRYYSIASEPQQDNRFELCLNPVRDKSPFGRYLAGLRPGEDVDFQGPAGSFRLRSPLRESIFLAIGTAITPIRSMLRHLLAGKRDLSRGAPLTLIYGARTPEWLLYADEFRTFERRRKNFRFWPTLSRPSNGWQGKQGYVQRHLDEALEGSGRHVDFYLCGRRAMVEEAHRHLWELGFSDEVIFFEKHS